MTIPVNQDKMPFLQRSNIHLVDGGADAQSRSKHDIVFHLSD
jgi:hypothetical protein